MNKPQRARTIKRYPFKVGDWVVWGSAGRMGQISYYTSGGFYATIKVNNRLVRKRTSELRQLHLNAAA